MRSLLSVLFLINVLLFAISTMAADVLEESSDPIKDEIKITDAIATPTPEPNTILLKEMALGTPPSADAANPQETTSSTGSANPVVKGHRILLGNGSGSGSGSGSGRVGHGTPGVTKEMLRQELIRRQNALKSQ